MDITEVVSTEYVEFDPATPVSKVVGAFEDPSLKAVVVSTDAEFEGLITRRGLAASRRHPGAAARSLVEHVPRVAPDEDVREVARLMVEARTHLLPVFEGRRMRGVVTADDLLRAVQPSLDAVTVADAYSGDLETVEPDATFGEVVNLLREHRASHVPVVSGGAAVGMLSLYDVTGHAARAVERSQGGSPSGFDRHGGAGSRAGARSHGGFGAREGERARMLDLPVRDVMTSPVRTVRPDRTLAEAVDEMFAVEGSSLVVVDEGDAPVGIVTKTDVLDALTWEAEGNRAVQLYGADLLDDVTYDEVVEMIDRFDAFDAGTRIIDAKIHLHEHDETLRGTPLVLARLRLFTDGGLLVASGEGYGARHAINEARDALERQIRDGKTYGRTKKHPDAEFWERRFGWWLEGEG
jgi:CBS domain-containing protein/ribosome-associated translation inhibitor RaiA